MAFIDNLYFGLGYEYHAAGHLWRLGMEAYKMDADFGFDLLAYNQAQRTFKSTIESKPYLFQVKAARVYEWKKYESGGGERAFSEVRFFLNKEHLETLVKEPNSYAIFYIVDKKENEVEEIVSYFWLSNEHLQFLYNDGWKWFTPDPKEPEKKMNLTVRVNSAANPKNILNANLENLLTKIQNITVEDKKNEMIQIHNELNKWLDKAELKNNNSRVYMELKAINKFGGDSYKMLSRDLYELSNFEKDIKLF